MFLQLNSEKKIAGRLAIFLLCLVFAASIATATDYNSTNFINRDPIIAIQGGISTSTNFQLISGSGQMVIGQSQSMGGSAFISRSGFFYYPGITTPAVAATAGNASVSLTWTAAAGALGFNVSGYQVGKSTASGGPYTFSSVGNVLSSTQSSLTNGTTYYFVVRVLDGLSNVITTSTQVSATPVAPVSACGNGACSSGETCSSCPADCGVCGGSGGGGGGGGAVKQTSVTFLGRAYPLSKVTILKDGQKAITTITGPDSNFNISLSNLSGGNYNFSVYVEDNKGRRSTTFSFPVFITESSATTISGIFLSPTIDVDKSEVKKGDNLTIFGQSVQNADVVIAVNSDQEYFVKTKTDKNGVYLNVFDTSPLELGQHLTKSKALAAEQLSSYSQAVAFKVGAKNVARNQKTYCVPRADLNNDCRVNLIDFSIAAYWWKRKISADFAVIEKAQLNGDGKVDLVDFSILAYNWSS